mmetsp:Transcript_9113/g.25546  ORF Transcript_9113/g.25546 Transcript_9113/m.25546 type:complete len:215 (+) Transcript_9113:156-800(+)
MPPGACDDPLCRGPATPPWPWPAADDARRLRVSAAWYTLFAMFSMSISRSLNSSSRLMSSRFSASRVAAFSSAASLLARRSSSSLLAACVAALWVSSSASVSFSLASSPLASSCTPCSVLPWPSKASRMDCTSTVFAATSCARRLASLYDWFRFSCSSLLRSSSCCMCSDCWMASPVSISSAFRASLSCSRVWFLLSVSRRRAAAAPRRKARAV